MSRILPQRLPSLPDIIDSNGNCYGGHVAMPSPSNHVSFEFCMFLVSEVAADAPNASSTF